jgi:hypothetical protein
MDQRGARKQMNVSSHKQLNEWSTRAINRAAEKIRIYTDKGKKECELDLKYPPRNPDDDISCEVAEILVVHFEAIGYSCQMIQRVNHNGAICRIKWSGNKRLDSNI